MKMTVTWQRNFTAGIEVDADKMAKVFGSADPAVIAAYLAAHPLSLLNLQAEEQPLTVQVSFPAEAP